MLSLDRLAYWVKGVIAQAHLKEGPRIKCHSTFSWAALQGGGTRKWYHGVHCLPLPGFTDVPSFFIAIHDPLPQQINVLHYSTTRHQKHLHETAKEPCLANGSFFQFINYSI